MLVAGFYLLLILLVALIFTGLQKSSLPAEKRRTYMRALAIGISGWLLYAYALSSTGFFQVYTVPPRIALFLILPLFAGMAYFFFSNKYEDLIRAVPPAWPVYLQSFRVIVEILILGMFWQGFASVEPTLEGYNFDILAGLTAPFVAFFILQRKMAPRRVAMAWNIFGLLLLANVVIIFNTLILRPSLWGYPTSPVKPEFGTMPYLLVAGVFMPVAVFMHLFSIAQLKRQVEGA